MKNYHETMKELLIKFDTTPGKCTSHELQKVKEFFEDYKYNHDIYTSAMNRSPVGQTLDVELDKVNWYIYRFPEKFLDKVSKVN